ncbi:hypothetical protein L1987_83974 [Smallanthus sonchifolius]|uniref:Uncharacterized protein n=1 Tax=Smallanthus sonchifolius TaxID=185202 RepID=A0ACB8YEM7_9ASTR|nr:hypothetical protein L1987_83974 [Smallanthus sonchifolius]
MNEFNQYYGEVSRELEAEKKRREMIPSSSRGRPWFDEPTDGLPAEELEQYLWSLGELKKKVLTRADELVMVNKYPAMLGVPTNVFGMGWNGFNGGQTVGVPAKAAVHGGFIFQHGGEIGKF